MAAELQKEVNYQHNVVAQLQKQVASQRGLIDQQNRQLAQLGIRVDTERAALNARPARQTTASARTQRGGVASRVVRTRTAVPNDILAYMTVQMRFDPDGKVAAYRVTPGRPQ
ncbi:MAG: hypothetical protein DLM53_09000 [Candidatus Eremiobacter antarcticus]|nr:hypothetical protein [Candidatus Eremiobacteraeota bacterium]MBC5807591.1 hypothetical protein [Candidatus Eremiobacteraeota bacterium]PZR61358.1 MAG: hypothetical protein DLM53_09000 [Candidatus Eremiobacter sp. RRmetagenome_bin22]